jgi:glycosyltransferase involved in cell wall biosynthesis
MELVSIIIPVYNSATHLAASIESALAQTYERNEIIVVDDGSKDGSYDLAKKFESEVVKVIRQENAGAAVARNTGLAHASGSYIQFLDAGDLLDPNKIEAQVQALNGSQTKLAVCKYVQFATEQELHKPVYPDQHSFIYSSDDPVDFLVNLWGGKGEANFIQTNCWLVPKALIEKAGTWRAYRCPDDDGEFFARMVLASEGIVFVPAVLNYYRIDEGSNQLSRNKKRKYLQNTLLTIDLKYRYTNQKKEHPLLARAFAKQYMNFAVYQFPQQKILSCIAWRRYRSFGESLQAPLLGGKAIEFIKHLFGWRVARLIRYYIRGI